MFRLGCLPLIGILMLIVLVKCGKPISQIINVAQEARSPAQPITVVAPVRPIRFQPGAYGATISDQIASGEMHPYSIACRAGQQFTVRSQSAHVDLVSPKGRLLGATTTEFTVQLPEDGDYRLRVKSNGKYTVQIEVR